MAEYDVTSPPNLPPVGDFNGQELITVWQRGRMKRVTKAALGISTPDELVEPGNAVGEALAEAKQTADQAAASAAEAVTAAETAQAAAEAAVAGFTELPEEVAESGEIDEDDTRRVSARRVVPLLNALVGETPVLPPGATTGVPLAAVLPSDVRAFGAPVNTGSNIEDSLNARAGLLAAFASGKAVVLPEGEFYIPSQALRTENLPRGSVISIRGAGSKKTTLRFESNFEATQAVVFGNLPDDDGAVVQFPSTNGSSLVNENPSTTISVAAKVLDKEITLASVAGIAAGDIIKIKTWRLDQRGENRNSVMRGETNEVVSVDVPFDKLLLRYPLADSYDPVTVHTGIAGTITAATSYSITVTGVDPGSADAVSGCRLEITGGTGAGQVRWITSWDATTGVAKFDGESDYAQSAFTTLPDATSTFTIKRTPYVFVTKALAGLELSGLTIICNDKLSQGLSIRGIVDPKVEDVVVRGARQVALTFSGCVRPRTRNFTAIDCNDESEGYTIIANACRDCDCVETHTRNGRRGGLDTAGTTPTWGGRVRGGSVIGGMKSVKVVGTGESRVVTYPLWDPVTNPNYGIGEHGQARDFTYSDFIIEGVAVGAVSRGKNTAFHNITMVGPIQRHYYCSAGTNHKISNAHFDARADQSVRPAPDVPGDEGHFVVINGVDFTGPLYVEGSRLDGLQGSLIYCLVNGSLGVRERVSALVTFRDTRVKWYTTKNIAVFDGNDNYAINGWDIDKPVFTFAGTGTFAINRKLLITAAGAGQSVWFKYGNNYHIAVAYQSTVSIPFPIAGTQLGVEIYPVNTNNQLRGSGFMRALSTVWAPHATNIGSTAIAGFATAPTGTSGTVGQVTLHHTGGNGNFILENQMQVSAAGVELQASLRLSGDI